MRVLVCGGRNYGKRLRLFEALDDIDAERGIAEVIHGGARGADSLAGEWASCRGVECRVFAADWILGKRAGPLRNQRMLDEGKPDVVIAFEGGKGTADMVRRARAEGIEVIEVQ